MRFETEIVLSINLEQLESILAGCGHNQSEGFCRPCIIHCIDSMQWVFIACSTQTRESQMINCLVPQCQRKCAEISCTRDWSAGVDDRASTPAELYVRPSRQCCHVSRHCTAFHEDPGLDLGVPATRIKQLSTTCPANGFLYLSQLRVCCSLVIKRSSSCGFKVVQGHSERCDLALTRDACAAVIRHNVRTDFVTDTKLYLSNRTTQVWW